LTIDSAESPCTIENPPIVSSAAREAEPATTVPSPSGAPTSTMLSPFFPAQLIHASIPAFACSGVALAICARADTGER
jgi:hypothetical protein